MRIMISGLALLMLVGATIGYAQYYGRPSYHASTAGEGYARGMADVVRSRGQAAYMGSEAAINMTVAQRNASDNQVQRTNNFFEMRRINREARAAENPAKSAKSKEYWIRHAQEGKPKRLSPGELNTVTGALAWPTALQTDVFAKDKAALEKLFARRAADGAILPENREKMDRVVKDMTKRLKSQIRDIPTDKYVVSQQFLKSLAYEVRFPAS